MFSKVGIEVRSHLREQVKKVMRVRADYIV